ncbi:MAG: hypothetical protein J6V44_11755 [Methanobrevibacter sp.]|nr:hypothetical protein [Methanobrevibacter sp.]
MSYAETTASSYASVNASSGVVTWNANGGVTSDRSVGITVTATNADSTGKTATKAATSTCLKDAIKTYGDIVITSHGTASDIPASGGSSTASGGSGTQTITWNSGYTSAGTVTCGSYNKVEASSLTTTTKARTAVGTSSATLTGQGSKTATVSVTVYQGKNEVTNSAYNAYNDNYYANCSIGSGITAAGGSATVTASAGHTYYYQYLYTSGSVAPSSTTYYSSAKTDTPTLSLQSNGNSRFTLSGTTLSHESMTTNATTDKAVVRCTNAGKTTVYKDAEVSVTNAANASSKITAYGTPTVTIGSGITAAGGSATITASVTNTRTYYYTSGSAGNTASEAGSIGTISIYEQFIGTSSSATSGTTISRFTLSNTTLSHSSMTSNVGYDCVRVRANNAGATSTYGYSSYSRTQNAANASSAITTYGTPSVSIGSGITAGGGSATISRSVTNKRTYYYTSGTAGTTSDEAGSVTLSIASQYHSTSSSATSGTSISRYSLSGTTLSHSTMGTTTGYDFVTIKAVNANSASLSATASTKVQNSANASYSTPSITAYSYATFARTGATKTPTVTYTQTPYYTSGSAGSAITSGGTLTFAASSSVTGCTLNSSSTGSITWANNNTTSARSAKSVLTVKVTMNGKTSAAYTCTACDQEAGKKEYGAWSVSISASPTSIGATGGDSTVTASASRT